VTGPDRPLDGLAVLVARAPGQAAALSDRVRQLGGEPVEAPTIRILPGDRAGLTDALREAAAGRYAAICFTSPNGVEAVAAALADAGLDAGVLTGVQVAAVGAGTAGALRRVLGVEADLVPDRSTTAALGGAFPPGHGRVLLPRADIASPGLPRLLEEKGYEPVVVAAYVTGRPDRLPPSVERRLTGGGVDLVAFTSSSTVRNFAALVGDRPWQGRVVSIGPVTSRTCRQLGIEVAVEAEEHDLDGLVAALVAAARPR
jgi:uroporphyrinogen-III synthase